MKRDMDIIRRIALETSALPLGKVLDSLEGVDSATFGIHVEWMKEAGLVVATTVENMSDGSITAFVMRLTWNGCEFADAVRSDTLWAKAKKEVIKPGISFSFDLLKEWLKSEISQGFPTLRGLTE
jgi:hypothetical protein